MYNKRSVFFSALDKHLTADVVRRAATGELTSRRGVLRLAPYDLLTWMNQLPLHNYRISFVCKVGRCNHTEVRARRTCGSASRIPWVSPWLAARRHAQSSASRTITPTPSPQATHTSVHATTPHHQTCTPGLFFSPTPLKLTYCAVFYEKIFTGCYLIKSFNLCSSKRDMHGALRSHSRNTHSYWCVTH